MAILSFDGKRSFVGRCIRESESNRHDDSDFFMLVWNDETGKPESKMFATTRGGCGMSYGSRADADKITLAKYALYCERRAQASSKAIRSTALSRAREVRTLESKVPGYVKLRKAYCSRLSFLDPRVLDDRDNGLEDYLSLLDLLSNKRIRSAFKLNLRAQVQTWLDDDSPRYAKPLSPRQMAYLPLKAFDSLAPAVEPDYSSIVVFDHDVQDTDATQTEGTDIMNTEQSIPDGYIIRNDGMFGEWNLWLDDNLGTIIGNGYDSKQDAMQTAWQHKNQSNGGNVKNTISIYDAKTEAEFVQGAKNLAYDIANQQSYPDIVDALLGDDIESVSEVFQLCWDNYTCYSPFEMVISAINKLGEDESSECWDALQDAIQEVFESVAGEVLNGVKSEIRERIIDVEDAFTIDDEQIDEMLDSSQDVFTIGEMEFLPSDIIKSCDPIAYNEVKAEYINFMINEDEEIQALVDLLNNVSI